jgi:recombination protein RecA
MSTAAAIRSKIEAALADRIPSALTPPAKTIRPVTLTGIRSVDEILEGGLPIGTLTELVGGECSGRTSLALSFLAELTGAGKVCAWIDVSNSLNPESAAAVGLDLSRLLWVRCGVLAAAPSQVSVAKGFVLPEKYLVPPPIKKGLHGGGFGQHPRNETKGVARAVSELLSPQAIAPRCAEPQRRVKAEREIFEPRPIPLPAKDKRSLAGKEPLARIAQALRAADLLLQAGGFSAIVLDLGSIAPEHALRVPLNKWHRYRLAAERCQASVLLLTQHACAKSSAGLVLQMLPGKALRDETTVFTGLEYRVEVLRERFKPTPTNVVPLRKPPARTTGATWHGRSAWAGRR